MVKKDNPRYLLAGIFVWTWSVATWTNRGNAQTWSVATWTNRGNAQTWSVATWTNRGNAQTSSKLDGQTAELA